MYYYIIILLDQCYSVNGFFDGLFGQCYMVSF